MTNVEHDATVGCFSDVRDDFISEPNIKAAEQVLREIETHCHKLLDDWESHTLAEKIKVAILDTGIDREHEQIKNKLGKSKQIRDYKEWRNGELHEPSNDTAGHGTHCTSLLARVVPEKVAYIYVGKVAESTDSVSPLNVAAGIRYAALKWQVDIITLSLGFDIDDPGITQAIDEARARTGRKTLLFAAASNRGNTNVNPIAFPARLDEVICVLAANATGTYLSTFSTSSVSQQLATLGEAVPSAYLPAPSTIKALSGTSMATPILAGTAAIALFFVGQEMITPVTERHKNAFSFLFNRHLRTMAGITLLLRQTAAVITGQETHYVVPYLFFTWRRPREELAWSIYNLFSPRFDFKAMANVNYGTTQSTIVEASLQPRTFSSPAKSTASEFRSERNSAGNTESTDEEYVSFMNEDSLQEEFEDSQRESGQLRNAITDPLGHAQLIEDDIGSTETASRPALRLNLNECNSLSDQNAVDQLTALARENHLPSTYAEITEEVNLPPTPSSVSVSKDERQDLLNWLGEDEDQGRLYSLVRSAYPGTTDWFATNSKVKSWLSVGKRRLFCFGGPGNGKSVLAAHFICTLLQNNRDGETTLYALGDSRYPRSMEGQLLNFLRQICAKTDRTHLLLQRLRQLFQGDTNRLSGTDATWALRICVRFLYRTFIIVDGLDEYEEQVRRNLLSMLNDLRAAGNVSVMVFSRPISSMMDEIGPDESLSISVSSTVLRSYIEHRMVELPSVAQENDSVRQKIIQTVSLKADGNFLFARLYMDKLAMELTKHGLSKTLDGTPTSLFPLYDKMLDAIQHQPLDVRVFTMAALMWTAWARRPLTSVELSVAVNIGNSNQARLDFDRIEFAQYRSNLQVFISASGGMFYEYQISESSKGVRLAHYSMFDYLYQERDKWFPGVEKSLASACIDYLSKIPLLSGPCVGKEDWVLRSQHYPLLGYTARYWGVHAKRSETETPASEGWLKNALGGFGTPFWTRNTLYLDAISQARRLDILEEPNFYNLFPAATTAFHLAAYFGLTALLDHLNRESQPSLAGLRDSEGSTPLWYASLGGHLDVVRELLTSPHAVMELCVEDKQKAKFVAEVKCHHEIGHYIGEALGKNASYVIAALGQTPLFLAALQGHDKMVRHILNTGQIRQETVIRDCELIRAYAAEHSTEKAFRLILNFIVITVLNSIILG